LLQEGRSHYIPIALSNCCLSSRLTVFGSCCALCTTADIEAVWVLWQEVPDFYGSGASDRHYILDRQTGEIRFGNGQAGMIPPRGRNNIRLSFYRTGGGKQGNVISQTISQLKTTVPYIDRVINLEAAAGGAQQETLDRLEERVPKQLRHRDRAVTLEDIADLAYEASTDVARVKVVPPDLLTTNFSPLNENLWLDPTKADVSFEDSPLLSLSGVSK
jgi:predicted phage baseplate assembly protein